MFRLDGKVALVTGASRGIGKAIAKALAGQGAHVAINYVSRAQDAQQLVDELVAGGASAEVLGFDVCDSAQVDRAIGELVKRHQKLDILVANAGISIDGLLLRIKDEELDRMLDVNVGGALACARAAIKPMMRARSGRIVFVSSVVGETGNAGQVGYAASKAAILGMTKALAREYGSRGVTVNAVAPGFIETDMTAGIGETMRAALVAQLPLGRLGQAEDVAAAVAYLCSDEAAYVTGQTVRVNGGMYM